MNGEEMALRKACHDDPNCTTPVRLVYADYLEERGQSTRAAFLRRQHRLPMVTVRSDPELWPDSVQTLLGSHSFSCYWCYQGGFVRRVQCPLMVWMVHGPTLMELHGVTWLRILGKRPVKHNGFWGWLARTQEQLQEEHPSALPWQLVQRMPRREQWGDVHIELDVMRVFGTHERDCYTALLEWAELPPERR